MNIKKKNNYNNKADGNDNATGNTDITNYCH